MIGGGSGSWWPPRLQRDRSRGRDDRWTVASSSALIGFGLDSVIDVGSAFAVAWQFAGADPEASVLAGS
jgi:hypothetical protein